MTVVLAIIALLCCHAATTGAFILDHVVKFSGNGETPDFWRNQAKANIQHRLHVTPNVGMAKNVMLFLGDGMSIPTITAARIMKGQLANKTGEETVLSWETFPATGFSKTYAQDSQVTDSASSGTAYLCGVKANKGTIGVDARTTPGDCASSKGAELTSILDWSVAAGKSVGIVTVTRVTHATLAATYANVADRSWEGDHDTTADHMTGGCRDIAAQLIEDYRNVQVIMGGGRRFFKRYDQPDPEHGSNAQYGRRDGRDLIEEWKAGQHSMGRNYHYVWNETEFNSVDPATADSIMALFSDSHMNYDYERKDPNHEQAGEPSLAEMTDKAIRILSKNPKGFFLLVEEKVMFGDHLYTGDDGLPYTTLMYANGPGFSLTNGHRTDISHVDTTDTHYLQQAAVPLSRETHGGDDVGIFAKGPMSHLLTGVHEQNYIAHVMGYASCVGDYSSPSTCAKSAATGRK